MRGLRGVTAGVLAATVLSGVALSSTAWAADKDLLAGLDRLPEAQASQALRARVEARAAIGAPEAPLADWLASEGFKVSRMPGRGDTRYGEAFKTTGSPVCRKQALVQWRATADGAVTWLDAHYGIGACL
jgi:hypothetical protein